MKYRTDHKGTGVSIEFAKTQNAIANGLNNMEIKMPSNVGGVEPVVSIGPDRIVLDFSDVDFASVLTGGEDANPYFQDDTTITGASSGSGSGLPTGAKGDILYHDGTDWVNLSGVDGATVLDGMTLNISGTTGDSVPTWDYVRLTGIYDPA